MNNEQYKIKFFKSPCTTASNNKILRNKFLKEVQKKKSARVGTGKLQNITKRTD